MRGTHPHIAPFFSLIILNVIVPEARVGLMFFFIYIYISIYTYSSAIYLRWFCDIAPRALHAKTFTPSARVYFYIAARISQTLPRECCFLYCGGKSIFIVDFLETKLLYNISFIYIK